MDMNVIPTEFTVKQITQGSLKESQKFFKIIEPLTKMQSKGILIDDFQLGIYNENFKCK